MKVDGENITLSRRELEDVMITAQAVGSAAFAMAALQQLAMDPNMSKAQLAEALMVEATAETRIQQLMKDGFNQADRALINSMGTEGTKRSFPLRKKFGEEAFAKLAQHPVCQDCGAHHPPEPEVVKDAEAGTGNVTNVIPFPHRGGGLPN
jgi:acyl-homoserine lactone acylase PvdQ